MNQNRMFTKILLYNLVQFSIIYGVAILIASFMFGRLTDVLYTLLTFVPFVFYFYVRTFVKNRVVMFALHLLPIIIATMLFTNVLERVFVLAILAVMFVLSIAGRIKNTPPHIDKGFSAFIAVFLTVLCFLGVWQGYYFLATVYPIVIIVAVLATVLHSRIDRTDSSLDAITQTSTQPIDRILAFDNKTNPILVAILLVLSLLFWLLLINPLLVQISQIEFTGNPIEIPAAEHAEPPPAAEGLGLDFSMFMDAEQAAPHPFWELLSAMIFFVLQAAALLFGIFLVVRGVIMLYRFLAYNPQNIPDISKTEEKTFIFSEKASNIQLPFLRFLNLSTDKTRVAFRKKILYYKKRGVPLTQFDTPAQITAKIAQSHNENIEQLAQQYEQIRYSAAEK
ncbi:MAG: hypothetical protein FWG68_10815 [Defluviitaleaceae bacterium]|nr:hypothetical protein [Defluviitaleaceae bacterium]